jgi:hypothetical protein
MRHPDVSPSLGLCALLLLCACGSETEDVSTLITVSCDTPALEVWRRTRCTASATDAEGQPVELSSPYSWSSSDSRVARVDEATGEVTALARGSVAIRAKVRLGNDSLRGELTLSASGMLHQQDLVADETWHEADNPHVVSTSLVVGGVDNPRLTLEPGVVVRFNTGAGLYVGGFSPREPGVLDARGTEERPVLLTSVDAAPQPGAWVGVVVKYARSASALRHTTVEYAGGEALASGEEGTALVGSVSSFKYVTGEAAAPLLVEQVTVRHNKAYGVYLSGVAFAPGSRGLRVSDSGGPAVVLSAGDVGSLPVDSDFTGNTAGTVDIVPGVVGQTQTWPNPGGTGYRLLGPRGTVASVVSVGSSAHPVLTLSPGTVLRMAAGSAFIVGPRGMPGSLVAEGSPGAPIQFLADAPAPAPGFWGGLSFDDAVGSRLNQVTVSHAGSPFHDFESGAGLRVERELGPFVTRSGFSHSPCGISRAASVTTDFTRAEYGNTFGDNAEGAQCTRE